MKQIRIEVETCLTEKGEAGFRVVSVDAAEKKDLPVEYLDGEKSIFMENRNYKPNYALAMRLRRRHTVDIDEEIVCGSIWSTEKFEKLLSEIREAGQRLHEILKARRELDRSWCGRKETFII